MHVLAGVATTLFVFPLVSDAGRRTLVKRWSVRLLRILAVEMRIDGDIGAHRGNVMVVANHISWLDINPKGTQIKGAVAREVMERWPSVAKIASISILKNETKIFNTLESKHTAKKAEKIYSECSIAFKEKILKCKFVKRIEKKIRKKKYSCKKRR